MLLTYYLTTIINQSQFLSDQLLASPLKIFYLRIPYRHLQFGAHWNGWLLTLSTCTQVMSLSVSFTGLTWGCKYTLLKSTLINFIYMQFLVTALLNHFQTMVFYIFPIKSRHCYNQTKRSVGSWQPTHKEKKMFKAKILIVF